MAFALPGTRCKDVPNRRQRATDHSLLDQRRALLFSNPVLQNRQRVFAYAGAPRFSTRPPPIGAHRKRHQASSICNTISRAVAKGRPQQAG